uniref:Solute carrier family 2, facilitated glucose transporter member 9 n=1 Tax=Anas platyrhynchos TaxID=8839 RepID=A0A8B9SLT9_ANAPL
AELCQALCIYFYTFEVLQAAGFDDRMISYMTLSVGLSELLAAVVCSSIIERLGRKTLVRGGYYIMGSLLAAITVTLSLNSYSTLLSAGATISIRAEIFQMSCRPPAFVIGARRDLLILLFFLLCSSLQERLKQFCFLIFMGVLFTSGTIVHLFLPETKGKSIVEITEEFNKLNFKKKCVPATPNHVTEDYTYCTRL